MLFRSLYNSLPITIAKNVPFETVTEIETKSMMLPGKDSFVPGRFAMTCCVQDIQFVGFPCKYTEYKNLKQRDWITVTAKVNLKYHPIYKGQTPDSVGPVLTAINVEPAAAPRDDVVTFS